MGMLSCPSEQIYDLYEQLYGLDMGRYWISVIKKGVGNILLLFFKCLQPQIIYQNMKLVHFDTYGPDQPKHILSNIKEESISA